MRLENWYITDNDNGYMAPEMVRKYAHGEVYDNPNHADGTHVKTSYLVEINLKDRYVQTRNSRYELGTPDPEYAEFMEGLK